MTNISIRLRNSDIEKLKAIAEKKERYTTELIRLIIENWLKSQEF